MQQWDMVSVPTEACGCRGVMGVVFLRVIQCMWQVHSTGHTAKRTQVLTQGPSGCYIPGWFTRPFLAPGRKASDKPVCLALWEQSGKSPLCSLVRSRGEAGLN
jgi:hypothetical protein